MGKTLVTAEAKLHWLEFAPTPDQTDRPWLVFLHYFGGSARTWLPVIHALHQDFPCLAMDLRGFGTSQASDSPENPKTYAVAAMARDVAAVLAQLAPARYYLVGHSMGGKVALRLAADAACPPGLAGLILLAPSPPTPEPMSDKDRAKLKAAWSSEERLAKVLAQTTAKPLPDDLAKATIADNLQAFAAAWHAWTDHGSRENLSEYAGLIHVPVSLVVGEKDSNITPDLLRAEIADRLPDARASIAVVPKVAHLLPLEAPLVVADLITKAVGEGRGR